MPLVEVLPALAGSKEAADELIDYIVKKTRIPAEEFEFQYAVRRSPSEVQVSARTGDYVLLISVFPKTSTGARNRFINALRGKP